MKVEFLCSTSNFEDLEMVDKVGIDISIPHGWERITFDVDDLILFFEELDGDFKGYTKVVLGEEDSVILDYCFLNFQTTCSDFGIDFIGLPVTMANEKTKVEKCADIFVNRSKILGVFDSDKKLDKCDIILRGYRDITVNLPYAKMLDVWNSNEENVVSFITKGLV